jgi:hypothetical protein
MHGGGMEKWQAHRRQKRSLLNEIKNVYPQSQVEGTRAADYGAGHDEGQMTELSNGQYEALRAIRGGWSLANEAAQRASLPENSAHNTGSRLAKRPEIQQRIDEIPNVAGVLEANVIEAVRQANGSTENPSMQASLTASRN